jgi:hypothetical protein
LRPAAARVPDFLVAFSQLVVVEEKVSATQADAQAQPKHACSVACIVITIACSGVRRKPIRGVPRAQCLLEGNRYY